MNYSSRILVLAALVGVAASVQAAGFTDDFSTNQSGVSLYNPGSSTSGSTSIFTGVGRTLTNDQTSNDDPGGSRSRVAVSGGSFNLSNDEDVVSSGTVNYAFSSPLDLTGLSGIKLDFLSNDIAGTATVTLWDMSNVARTYTAALPGLHTGDPFSILLLSSGGSANLSQIGRMSIFLSPGAVGGDLSLDKVSTVSTVPGPSALLTFGLAGAARLRRRRK